MFFAATTDSRSWRGQVIEAERRAAQPVAADRTWVYQFDWPTPIDGGKWGAHHGLDVPFAFDNAVIVPEKVGQRRGRAAPVRAHERRLPDVRAFWRSQRREACRAGRRTICRRRATMMFDAATRVVDDPRGNERRLFAQVPYVQPGT